MATIPKYIQNKMHKMARLTHQAGELDREINEYFENLGYDVDALRCGDGKSLEELNYGNDVTDEFANDFALGLYEKCRN